MKPIHSAFLFTALLAIAPDLRAQEAALVSVIPKPREITTAPGHFRITAQTRIILANGATVEDRFAADQLNEHLIGLGLSPLEISEEVRIRKRETDFILLGPPLGARSVSILKETGATLASEMKEEGYLLSSTSDRIAIVAESPRGRFYGMMTLLQLVRQEKRTTLVPRVFIRDWPAMKMRGITDDLSRGQVSTLENFKKIIRFLSRHKLNVYSPYLEDIFEFRNHPQIGRGRGALTADEIRVLDAFAKQHHVELIPIFETLGHWENILLLPEYQQYAEFPGAHTVNVSDGRIYTLLDEMIGEVASAFSSRYFNMAADESWDVGLGASKQRVAESDLATVHADHYKRLFAILDKHGKRPMMYGDILLNHPSILEKILRDVVIVDWQYWGGDSYPSPAVFRTAGFPFIVSPAIWNFTGPFPNYLNTTINVLNFARDGSRNGTLGILTSNWNDYGGETFREFNYYGFAWTAECGWNPEAADPVRFDEVFFPLFSGSKDAGRALRTAYQLLSNVYTQLEWHEIWRHPLLPERESGLRNVWRFQAIESTMPLVREVLDAAEQSFTANRDHLDYLRFVTRLSEWFVRKVRAARRIIALQRDSALADPEKEAAITAAALSVVPSLEALKREFQELWLRTNRPANLQLLLDRYDRQALCWKELAAKPMRNRYEIPSAWMYHPSANPYVRDSSLTQVPRAFFRISWDAADSLAPGGIQVIADTFAEIFINGVPLGTLLARRSLSLTVEQERVKKWDLTQHLRPGKNTLAIAAANYDPFGSAGVNVLGYHVDPGGAYKVILLDTLVRVSTSAGRDWQQPEYDDSRWIYAVPKSYPATVVAPDFERGRLSWIER